MPIYTPDNFYGDCFVDGKKLDKCFYADTDNGIAKAYVSPLVIKKPEYELETYELKGVVTVKARNRDSGKYL